MRSMNLHMVLLVTLLLGACAVTKKPDPPGLANASRDQIGLLAVRSSTSPVVTLASELDNKGAAARKTAVAAGVGWLNGSFEAAGQSGSEGALLVAAFGIVTAPLVAVGGAVYGAAAADTKEAIAEGNEVLRHALDFAPARLQRVLQAQFAESAPISYEFVADLDNSQLAARGFDSVLDIEMSSIASHPSENQFHVYFETFNRMRLTSLVSGQLLATRSYRGELAPRSVSDWARADGEALVAALNESFAEFTEDMAQELFVAPAIRVRGMEPVSRRRFRIGTISGLRPMFVWSALDGGNANPHESVEYEIVVAARSADTPARRMRTRGMHYVPPEPLQACRIYSWRVRAHYTSFGSRVTSEWTPEYRFKTPCKISWLSRDSAARAARV